jgi:hypothetical protein
LPAFARDGAQTDIQTGQVRERFAAVAQQVGDEQRPPRLVSDGRREGRRQLASRIDLASPIGERGGFVEILVVGLTFNVRSPRFRDRN